MSVLDAIHTVLSEAAEPLHYQEITKRLAARKPWSTQGKEPASSTVVTQLGRAIKKGDSRFHRTGRGVYAAKRPTPPHSVVPEFTSPMSFADAAERVLRQSGASEAMNYQDITKRALDEGLISTASKEPAATMNGALNLDISRREAQREPPRFVRPMRGMFGLAQVPDDVRDLIDRRNSDVRARLLKRALEGSPADFEQLIQTLLMAMGFADVEGTPLGGDGGIDVRGTLVVGDVVNVRMAVQAKRWQGNVGAPVVQQVRGSLGAHEQGLIITTSDFSKGARQEAQRLNAAPVALMNGEQLATLLAKHAIGVRREEHVLLALAEPEEPAAAAPT